MRVLVNFTKLQIFPRGYHAKKFIIKIIDESYMKTLLIPVNNLLEINCLIEASVYRTFACVIDLLVFKGLCK